MVDISKTQKFERIFFRREKKVEKKFKKVLGVFNEYGQLIENRSTQFGASTTFGLTAD